MSGGVDSSTCAALLLEQGYHVEGVTALFHDDEAAHHAICDARLVCETLGIRHTVVDAHDTFNREVISTFCSSCQQGATPSPCVLCNRHCKIPTLQQAADELGCHFIATGHYAKMVTHPQSGRYTIRRADDPRKDQSYMLSLLAQSQLERLILPLGTYEKPQVRKLAAALKLPVAQRLDSQDLCFIEGDYRDFLHDRGIQDSPGPIITLAGDVVGQHAGLHRYTLGQRKGLGVALGKPQVVVEKRMQDNALVIAPKDQALLSALKVTSVNVLAYEMLADGMRVQAKIRYRSTPVPATLYVKSAERSHEEGCGCSVGSVKCAGNTSCTDTFEAAVSDSTDASYSVRVEFDTPQDLTAPGQIAAFYEDDLLVAAGIIEQVDFAHD